MTYVWGNNKRRADIKGRRCRVLARHLVDQDNLASQPGGTTPSPARRASDDPAAPPETADDPWEVADVDEETLNRQRLWRSEPDQGLTRLPEIDNDHAATPTDRHEFLPPPGGAGFRDHLNLAFEADLITHRERHQLRLAHDHALHAQPPAGEAQVLAEIDELIGEGVLIEREGR